MGRARLEIKAIGRRAIDGIGRGFRSAFRTGETSAKSFRKEAKIARKELAGLVSEQRRLNTELKGMKAGTAEYKRLQAEIKATGKAIDYNNRALNRAKRLGGGGGGGGRGGGMARGAFRTAAGIAKGGAGIAIGMAGSGGQPFAAMAGMASGAGGAVGNIPLVGGAMQMQDEMIAAGLREKQRRVTAWRSYTAASWRNRNVMLSPKGGGGVTRKDGDITGIRSAYFGPAESSSLLKSFSDATGGTFRSFRRGDVPRGQRGRHETPLGLAQRGFNPGVWSYLQTVAPGAGGMTYKGGGRGEPFASGGTIRNAAHLVRLMGEQSGQRFTGRMIESMLGEMTSYLQSIAEKGIAVDSDRFMGRQIQLFKAASKVSGQAGITPFSMGSKQSFRFRSQLNSATGGGGSMSMVAFMAALDQGMSVPEAMRAQQLGVGQGAGQVSMSNMLKTTQGIFGKGGKKFDIMDAMLMGEFGNPDFASLMRRMSSGGFRGGATQGPSALDYIAPKQGRADKKWVGLDWDDVKQGGRIGTAKGVMNAVKTQRQMADALVALSDTGWQQVIKQIDFVVGAAELMQNGMGKILDWIPGVSNASAQQARDSASALSDLRGAMRTKAKGSKKKTGP